MTQYKVELVGCSSYTKGSLSFIKGQPKIMDLSEGLLDYLRAQKVFKLIPQLKKVSKAILPKTVLAEEPVSLPVPSDPEDFEAELPRRSKGYKKRKV